MLHLSEQFITYHNTRHKRRWWELFWTANQQTRRASGEEQQPINSKQQRDPQSKPRTDDRTQWTAWGKQPTSQGDHWNSKANRRKTTQALDKHRKPSLALFQWGAIKINMPSTLRVYFRGFWKYYHEFALRTQIVIEGLNYYWFEAQAGAISAILLDPWCNHSDIYDPCFFGVWRFIAQATCFEPYP